MDHPCHPVQHDINRGLGATRNTRALSMHEAKVESSNSTAMMGGRWRTHYNPVWHRTFLQGVYWFQLCPDGRLAPLATPCPHGDCGRTRWLSFCESGHRGGKEWRFRDAQVVRQGVHKVFKYLNAACWRIGLISIARSYQSSFVVLRLYHQDAGNQMTVQIHRQVERATAIDRWRTRRLRRVATPAQDQQPSASLRRHREHTSIIRPGWRGAFRCGRRRQGLLACLKALAHRPLQPDDGADAARSVWQRDFRLRSR